MAGRDHAPSVRPTLALALRDGDDERTLVWEFQPQSCEFVRVACDQPRERYVAGAEFWASDILDALTFRAAADDLFHFGHKLLWNAAPDIFRCDLDTEIQLYAHPLRMAELVEPLYRSCLSPDVAVELRPSLSPEATAPDADIAPRRAPKVRPIPASLSAFRETSAAPVSAPIDGLDETALAVLREAVAQSTGRSWKLDAAEWDGNGIRVALSWVGDSTVLSVTSRAEVQRCYRTLGSIAFAYGPGSITGSTLSQLDSVIEAIAQRVSAQGEGRVSIRSSE